MVTGGKARVRLGETKEMERNVKTLPTGKFHYNANLLRGTYRVLQSGKTAIIIKAIHWQDPRSMKYQKEKNNKGEKGE